MSKQWVKIKGKLFINTYVVSDIEFFYILETARNFSSPSISRSNDINYEVARNAEKSQWRLREWNRVQ